MADIEALYFEFLEDVAELEVFAAAIRHDNIRWREVDNGTVVLLISIASRESLGGHISGIRNQLSFLTIDSLLCFCLGFARHEVFKDWFGIRTTR